MATATKKRVEGFAVEQGGGLALHAVGDEMLVKIGSRDTNGAFAVIEGCTQPGGGPPLHIHYEQDEWWYVIEGEFLFEVDGVEIRAGAGATVFAPKGSRHAFTNIGTKPARSLVTVVPGGLDEFFVDLDKACPRGTVPDPAVIAPVFQKHGLELAGPPLGRR